MINDNDIISYIINNDDSESRRQIDALRHENRAFDNRVTAWEGVLFGLHEKDTKPLKPAERVWAGIEEKLFTDTNATAKANAEKRTQLSWLSGWLPKLALPTVVAVLTFFAVKNMILSPSASPSSLEMTAQIMMQDTTIWDVQSDGRAVAFHNIHAIPEAEKVKCLVWAIVDGKAYALGDVPDEGHGGRKTLVLPENLQDKALQLIVQDVPMDSEQALPDFSRTYLSGDLVSKQG